MIYKDARRQEQLRLLQPKIHDFLKSYDPTAPTILFFPGGMASALVQATTSFSAGPPPYNYETKWLSLSTFCDDAAEDLRMSGDMDANDHVTVPHGIIGFVGISPYLGFEAWCKIRIKPFNYLAIPWDWRRPVEDAAEYVTTMVLPALELEIGKQYAVDFLNTNYYFIGHSEGGIVAKIILNQNSKFAINARRAITIATPFYGYGGSEHFYFSGFSYLNPMYSKQTIAEIIATFTGVYALMFLDEPIYTQVKGALSADPVAPLNAYPSTDLKTPNQDVDAYVFDPTRYPSWIDTNALAAAATTCISVAAALPPALAPNLFHIRGIRTTNGQPNGPVEHGTIATQSWNSIVAPYNANIGPDPISNPQLGIGDDTIPAWSARLVSAASDQVIDVDGDVHHMTLMDDPATLQRLEQLIDGATASAMLVNARGVFETLWKPVAPASLALEVISQASRARSPRARRTLFAGLPVDTVKRITRRILQDLINPPLVSAERPLPR